MIRGKDQNPDEEQEHQSLSNIHSSRVKELVATFSLLVQLLAAAARASSAMTGSGVEHGVRVVLGYHENDDG